MNGSIHTSKPIPLVDILRATFGAIVSGDDPSAAAFYAAMKADTAEDGPEMSPRNQTQLEATGEGVKLPTKPKDLSALAAVVRRDYPRRSQIARLLDHMNNHDNADFETLKDVVHQADVEPDTVLKAIKKARSMIVQYGLPITLVVSGSMVSRRDVPPTAPSPETSPK